MLRGAQTPGELKNRSPRLHQFESLAEVERTLSELASGFDALVRELATARPARDPCANRPAPARVRPVR